MGTLKKTTGGEQMNSKYLWWEAEAFTFYRVPKALITQPAYKDLSADAALLYGLLLDRMCLSAKNREFFTDRDGCIFVYFTVAEIGKSLNCGHDKATRLLNELEMYGLIARRRQGKGKPNKIYVFKFMNIA